MVLFIKRGIICTKIIWGGRQLVLFMDITTELELSTNFFSTDRTFYTRNKPWDLSRLARMRVMQDGAGKFEDA